MYKQIKPLEKSGKMQVKADTTEFIQKALFELGYKWKGYKGSNEVSYLTYANHWIIWREDKVISWQLNTAKDKTPDIPLHIFTDYFTTEPLK